jgi:hypothetical protein
VLAVSGLCDAGLDHEVPAEPGHGAWEQDSARSLLPNACWPALGVPGFSQPGLGTSSGCTTWIGSFVISMQVFTRLKVAAVDGDLADLKQLARLLACTFEVKKPAQSGGCKSPNTFGAQKPSLFRAGLPFQLVGCGWLKPLANQVLCRHSMPRVCDNDLSGFSATLDRARWHDGNPDRS